MYWVTARPDPFFLQILGLLLPSLFPSLFSHLLVMNTGLGVGRLPSQGWIAFRDFIKRSPNVDIGGLISRGTPLTADEVKAYRAPFEGVESKAGVRRFPVSCCCRRSKRYNSIVGKLLTD